MSRSLLEGDTLGQFGQRVRRDSGELGPRAGEGRKPPTRGPSCGPEPSAAARSTVPARSQPGQNPGSLASARRTSPRLSETAEMRTSASGGTGSGSSTSATESLLTASGSTTTARIIAIRTPPDLGHKDNSLLCSLRAAGPGAHCIIRLMQYATTKNLPENVDLMVLDASGTLREHVGLEELPDFLADKGSLVWCDIYSIEGGQNGPYGRLLREVFGFDALTIEDCFTRSHLPKVDVYDDYLFVALFSFHLSEKTRRVQTVEVDMYVGENYVVCVHTRPLRELDRVRRRLLAGNEFVASCPANVAHTVFDAVVDEYLPIMNRLSAIVDGIEDDLLAAGDASDAILDSLFHLKHELSALRRLAVPSMDIVGILMRPTVRLIPEESQMYYDDVRDHLVRVIDKIDTMRDYLPGSLDIYTTQQTQRINTSMQRLTAIATIFLPLTFITGIYGMNFSYIPESNWRYGFFAILVLSTFLAVGMVVYLWRKKMI